MNQIRENIIADIRLERERQDAKFGEQNHSPIHWIAILTEEVGEAAREAVDAHFGYKNPEESKTRYRAEMIQAAAVALSMIESFDRNEAKVKV